MLFMFSVTFKDTCLVRQLESALEEGGHLLKIHSVPHRKQCPPQSKYSWIFEQDGFLLLGIQLNVVVVVFPLSTTKVQD